MTLLMLRHILPIIINGTRGYTFTMFAVTWNIAQTLFLFLFLCFSNYFFLMQFVMIRSFGVLLSIYIMVLAFASVQRRQQVQVYKLNWNVHVYWFLVFYSMLTWNFIWSFSFEFYVWMIGWWWREQSHRIRDPFTSCSCPLISLS